MKNIFHTACWAILLSLAACGKKDASLIGLVPAKMAVNPATGILIKGAGLVNVQMDGIGAIRGLSDGGRFGTTDSFQTFQLTPVQLPAGAQYNYRSPATVINGMNILSPVYAVLPTTIGYSTDYGTTWHSVTPDLSGAPPAGYFSWQLEGLQYQGGQIFMASTRFSDTFASNQTQWTMLLYKVDAGSGQTVNLVQKYGYMPESLFFTNPDTGYIIEDTMQMTAGVGNGSVQKGFFSRTTDGGYTWTQPVALGANERHILATGPSGRLLVYDQDGEVYFSTDAGNTWKKGNIGQMLYSAFIADNNTVYGSGGNGLIKSTDFGATWKPINGPIGVFNLYFVDANHGIAYTKQSLYSTSDGGVTWKTLLYPYPYVTQ